MSRRSRRSSECSGDRRERDRGWSRVLGWGGSRSSVSHSRSTLCNKVATAALGSWLWALGILRPQAPQSPEPRASSLLKIGRRNALLGGLFEGVGQLEECRLAAGHPREADAV